MHHFDAFRYLFARQPLSVLASSFNPAGSDYDHEGGAHALLEFADGLKLQYSGTFVASRYDYEMRIEAANGEIKSNRSKVWWRPKVSARSASYRRNRCRPVKCCDIRLRA